MMQRQRINPQNNLPEPLGTVVLLANFGFGLWNVYSNLRQEKKQIIYDKQQQKILDILKGLEKNGTTDEI